MGLEGRDISDSEILEATRQVVNDQGKLQFQINLPSGREVTSEFFPQDLRKKAMMTWLDVVRQSRVDDAEEVRAIARRAVEEAKRGALYGIPESAPIASPNGEGTYSADSGARNPQSSAQSTNAGPTYPSSASQMQQSLTNPLDFAKQALSRVQQELREVDAQLLTLVSRQQVLMGQATQWQTVLSTFPSATPTSEAATKPRKRRKDAGVAKGTIAG